jgi:hypothetical protein
VGRAGATSLVEVEVPASPIGAQARLLSAPQPPQVAVLGGGLAAQCSSRDPQEPHR